MDKVVLPVVVQDRGPDSSCAVLGQGRRHLCRGAEAVSLGLAIQQTIEISQLRLIDKVFDDLVVQQVPRVQAWRRQSSPTVQLVLVLGCRRGEDGRDSTVAARCRDGCFVFLGPCAQAHGQG